MRMVNSAGDHQASDLQPYLPEIREHLFLEDKFQSKIGGQMFLRIFFLSRIEERDLRCFFLQDTSKGDLGFFFFEINWQISAISTRAKFFVTGLSLIFFAQLDELYQMVQSVWSRKISPWSRFLKFSIQKCSRKYFLCWGTGNTVPRNYRITSKNGSAMFFVLEPILNRYWSEA